MAHVFAFLSRFRSESGATAIEYALIASLISIAIVGGLTSLGVSLQANIQNTADQIAAAGS